YNQLILLAFPLSKACQTAAKVAKKVDKFLPPPTRLKAGPTHRHFSLRRCRVAARPPKSAIPSEALSRTSSESCRFSVSAFLWLGTSSDHLGISPKKSYSS